MDMKNSNKMFGWVQANDAGDSGRPRCLSCPLRSCYMRAAWLAVSWWMMGIEFWRSWVKVWLPAVSHTLTPRDAQLCQPHHPCQFISTICPCPSLRSRRASSKQVKMAAPGGCVWQPWQRGLLGDAQGCCAAVAIIQADPGSRYTIQPFQHLLSCETRMQQAAPPTSTRQKPRRLGIWSLSFGSARKAGNSGPAAL